MIRAILFNPAIDVHYSIPTFDEQTTFTGLKSASFPAGKAINFAKAVRILDEEVEVLGVVPERDILKFREFLNGYNIKHDLTEISGNTRINTTIFEENSQISYHLNSENEAVFESQIQNFNEKLLSKAQKDDFWIFSGSIPEGCDEEIYCKLIKHCNKQNIFTALDTRGNALKYGIQAQPFFITPNEDEFQDYYSEEIKGLQHITLKAKRMLDSGIKFVFVTLGKDGAVAFHGNQSLLCEMPEIPNQINTVGCGDAFLAGAVVGFQRGFQFSEIFRLALACGAANTLTREPCKIELSKVHYIMERIKVKSV